jgi:kynureninase
MNTSYSALAKKLDEADELKDFRAQFFIPKSGGKEVVYLCGNSLGLQPKNTSKYIQQELEDWATLGVQGHHDARNPWLFYHHLFTKPLTKLTGAKEQEVVAMNQLTVNLNLMLVSFYRPTATRHKILMQAKEFPSDYYAMEQQVKLHGYDPETAIIEAAPREGEYEIRTEDILALIDKHKDELSLIMFSVVNYFSGQVFDIEAISKKAREHGIVLGLDLAHAIGNIPLKLHEWNVDFATWCSYKYLNSGPGGVSGVFVHDHHHKNFDLPRFAGWWGVEETGRFNMNKHFMPMAGAGGWQLSNAPVLSMAAHKAALDIFDQAGVERLRSKSIKLTGFLAEMLTASEAADKFTLITPESRGCQLSIMIKDNGRDVFDHLTAASFICDWRKPEDARHGGVVRVAPVPLYNSFQDVYLFAGKLESLLNEIQH